MKLLFEIDLHILFLCDIVDINNHKEFFNSQGLEYIDGMYSKATSLDSGCDASCNQ